MRLLNIIVERMITGPKEIDSLYQGLPESVRNAIEIEINKIMPHFNEHALELSIMELFQQEGYTYTNGEEIHKEVSDVLLQDDMRLYLRSQYKAEGITPLEIERVLAKLTANVGFSLYEQNRHTYRLMTEGFR